MCVSVPLCCVKCPAVISGGLVCPRVELPTFSKIPVDNSDVAS